jgi:hypothetical protein
MYYFIQREFKLLRLLDILNLVGADTISVRYIRTLRKTSRTRTGVHTSYNTRKNVKQLAANGDNVFKISTFGPIRE